MRERWTARIGNIYVPVGDTWVLEDNRWMDGFHRSGWKRAVFDERDWDRDTVPHRRSRLGLGVRCGLSSARDRIARPVLSYSQNQQRQRARNHGR